MTKVNSCIPEGESDIWRNNYGVTLPLIPSRRGRGKTIVTQSLKGWEWNFIHMSIIIIGAGQIGQFIASKLSSEKKNVILIEGDEEKIAGISENLDVKVILGNGASPVVLKEAGIKNAQMLVAVTDSDEVNLLACMVSSLQTSAPIKIARVRNPDFYHLQESEESQKRLNIDMMINPDKEAADAILRTLSVPGSVDVINFFDGKMKIVGIKVRGKSEVTDTYLEKLKLLEEGRHLLFTAILRDGQTIIPTGKNRILSGDTVYFATESENIYKVMRLFGFETETTKRVMIHGGTFIGQYLARNLEQNDIQVKIIEPDSKLCSNLVRRLNKTVVLNESATDENLLRQENVGEMDAFISVTDDDEDNILSSLLAKRLGVPWTITVTRHIGYIPMITTIGIDVAISPRLISNSTILHFIRQGKVLSVSSLQEDIEILEIEALETSDIINVPIRDARLPKETLILSIQRGDEIIIPVGSTVIRAGDKVLIQANSSAVPKVEKLFTVKPEYF